MEELPLTEIQRHVAELILNTPVPGRHAARSAIRHIQKAWRIRGADAEMAVFRAFAAA